MKVGWEVRPLGEVVAISKTKGGSKPLPYVGLEDISSGGTGDFSGSLTPLSGKSTTFEFGPEHLLYGRLRPYLNKVFRPDFEGHCSSEIFPMLPSTRIDRGYLFYWITSDTIVEEINATSTGARMPRANIKEILTFPIPLPPLEEQQRIVAVLDEAFDGLALARAHAEANLQNARELFSSQLQQVFAQDLSTAPIRTFQELTEDTLIGLVRSKQEQGPDLQFDYMKMQNIGNDDRYEGKIVDRVDSSTKESVRFILKSGDFLFNTRNSRELVGKSCVIESDLKNPTVYNNNIMRVRFSSQVDSRYVALAFKSDIVKMQLEAMKSGTTNVVAIYHKSLKTLRLPIPDKKLQLALVARFNEIDHSVQSMADNYRNQIQDIDDLRQSLLQKAFAGELT